ncbi:Glutarate-semialdehyde dehydrogenase DavD [Sphaceloma murrayae]|uniref:Glutarate-semialdehyde dehydrogenase DavD n=1 Tax=Sphaceloma murrayae TaxID=2082308 RepID=A0A2K1QZ01_9PEZI|nr:Glutarate-semialdehyde dehydrogenase DavD [Sphaceloma murrayae]
MSSNGANGVDYTIPLWIDGKEVTTATTFDVQSPALAKPIWKCHGASAKEANEAVESSQRAFKTWRKTKPQKIRDILLKAADIMERRQAELADYQMQETGAPDPVVNGFMLPTTIEQIRDVAGRAVTVLGAIPQTTGEGTGAFVFKEPYGVNVAIAPWNAPFILGTRAMLYAIATGNTVVLKGSELSPRCFWALGSVFHEAGLPAGVLNVIYHQPSDAVAVTNAMIEHPATKKVNFTGSTAVGSIIASKAGKELKPVVMELGGKASAIVCKDAEIQNAAMQCAVGAFLHSGQICMSTERILVHKSILEPFSEALKGAIDKVYPKERQYAILVAKPAVEKNKKLLEDATSKGANLIYGDLDSALDKDNAYRMRPFVVSGVKPGMDLYYQESFGPSVSLLPFDSEQEAIDIANDTDYGLSGAVFSENLGRALRIAREIDSGAVHINSMSVHDEAPLPHGGNKKSGWGRFNGQWGMDEFLRLKTVTYKVFAED